MKQRRNRRAGEEAVQTESPRIPGNLFDIPRSAMPGGIQMEVSGNTEVVVDGCTGVLEYDETVIRLAGGKMNVKFTGRNLQIKVLTHDSAIIAGYILSIEFST